MASREERSLPIAWARSGSFHTSGCSQLGVYFFETLFLGIVVKDTPKNVGALREVLNAVLPDLFQNMVGFFLMDLSKCGDKSGILPDSRPYSYTVVNLARGDR
ncbi:hypothetical protein LNP74_07235 [Klebsiella pneumoniae subsp. pneumoniae]|nr:hypothetical protein [Klebsiella pneumoniae subsp. pneumoniae]